MAAFGQGAEGDVTVRLFVSSAGDVTNVVILECPGEKGMWEDIKQPLWHWEFEPATRDGLPVPFDFELTLPFKADWKHDMARMYPLSSEKVYSELLVVIKEFKLKLSVQDDDNQVLITKERAYRKGRKLPGLKERIDQGGFQPGRFQLHCVVPAGIEPARVYCNALLLRRDMRRSAHRGEVEGWVLNKLDERLGVAGRTIPANMNRRYALANELGAGLSGGVPKEMPEVQMPGLGDVHEPALISATKESPVFPAVAFMAKASGKLIYQVVVQEDGVLRSLNLWKGPEEEYLFDVAARQAIAFWRYQPARLYGSPVPVFITIVVTYEFQSR